MTESQFDNADLAIRISRVSRIAAQFTHELAYGMWNPHFCAADPEYAGERFLEAVEPILKQIRERRGRLRDPFGEAPQPVEQREREGVAPARRTPNP